ncbi:hypothetical protein [Kitasatospora griseola]|uniref:hypothetical protein n=1 Tax=Kitasatospora griseola TaxID=2064 RepID=UPI00166FEB62|nr:hypothetical protein [Kitasatospora griseola]
MFGRTRETLFPSRKAPAQTTTQAGQVRMRKYDGNTKAMAAAHGVSPRTVLRWIDGTRHPAGRHQDKLRLDAVEVQTTERGRERKAKQLARLGAYSGITARVGRAHTFDIRGSDAVRARDVHLGLTGDQAAALARAQDESEMRETIGEALAEYFNGGGGYAGFTAGGRPQRSCNRACESRAYRKASAERREDVVAAALVPPRGGVDGASEGPGSRQELLDRADAVRRTTVHERGDRSPAAQEQAAPYSTGLMRHFSSGANTSRKPSHAPERVRTHLCAVAAPVPGRALSNSTVAAEGLSATRTLLAR